MDIQTGFEYGVRHFSSEKTGLLSELVSEHASISIEQSLFLIQLGSIYVEQKRQTEDIPIETGKYIRAHTKPRRFPAEFNRKKNLIFENNDFVVVHKNSGTPAHETVDNILENFKVISAKALNTELFVTHRLDVPTEGLILYAKTKEFQSDFNQLLEEKKTEKIYVAMTENRQHRTLPPYLKHYMEKSIKAPKKLFAQETPNSQVCELNILEQNKEPNGLTQVRVQLITGRTHQIRTQLAFEGMPIVGDVTYGAQIELPQEQIFLCAESLKFTDKNSARFEFKTEKYW